MTGRPSKFDESRAEVLLKAAIDVFIDHGLASTSVDKLATAAGVSKATLYKYFNDKDDVFAKAIESYVKTQSIDLRDPSALREISEKELENYARQLINRLCNPKTVSVFRMIIAESGRSPRVTRRFYDSIAASGVDAVSVYFSSRKPELTHKQSRTLAFQFLGLMKEEIFWPLLFGKPKPSKPEINRIIDSALNNVFSK